MNKNTGFTLIELMLVIAIISILAAIAIPAYNHYIEVARSNAAIANYDTAFRLAATEASSVANGVTKGRNMVSVLDQGNRTSPYNSSAPAYRVGNTCTIKGQVLLSSATTVVGKTITVVGCAGPGLISQLTSIKSE